MWQTAGTDGFIHAIETLLAEQVFGAEYVGAVLARPADEWTTAVAWLQAVPAQGTVDRDLALYERYVH